MNRVAPRPAPAAAVPAVRRLGRRGYAECLEEMRAFVEAPPAEEVWLVEHPPVFTLGQAADRSHLLDPGDIPVVASDRGGQVTFHGPGQCVLYVLLDLKRRRLGVRRLVWSLEEAVVRLLETHGVEGRRMPGAPGVYVGERKLAALGLRVRRGWSYHGLALNVAMDLEPFSRIDPCGYPGLRVTQLADLGVPLSLARAGEHLARNFVSLVR